MFKEKMSKSAEGVEDFEEYGRNNSRGI